MSTEKKGKCAEEFKEPYHDDNEGKNQLEKNKQRKQENQQVLYTPLSEFSTHNTSHFEYSATT